MAFSPIPSAEEIVRLYVTGELGPELARHHEAEETFLQRCIELHNEKAIDLVVVPCQPNFRSLTKHAFFTAQHFYCEAIPKLDVDVTTLMECCRTLVEQAGTDGAAGQPNDAFRLWCQNHPTECASIISKAQSGDDLAKRFATFALQAAGNVETAINFVESYEDERRLFGMAALGRMAIDDPAKAQGAIRALEPFLSTSNDDNLRANALLAAFDVLMKHNYAEKATSFVELAAKEPGPATLHSLAQVIWHHNKLLTTEALRTALEALENVQSEHLGTVRVLDLALSRILGTAGETLAINSLSALLRPGKLTLENFPITSGELNRNNPQRRYELIVRWLLSANLALCSNVDKLTGAEEKQPFDTNVSSFELNAAQQIFLCRKAIGFLFLRPVICCSIIVSVLRGVQKEAEDAVSDLLFDPLLLSYGGGATDYLKEIGPDDRAHTAVRRALDRQAVYFAGLGKTGLLKELHPSDYKRDVVHQRTHDEMRSAQKAAQQQSVLFNLVHRSTLLYGKRSLTYIQEDNGNSKPFTMDLHSFGVSFEWPRRDILDPVGLDYMIRVFRVEKMQ